MSFKTDSEEQQKDNQPPTTPKKEPIKKPFIYNILPSKFKSRRPTVDETYTTLDPMIITNRSSFFPKKDFSASVNFDSP